MRVLRWALASLLLGGIAHLATLLWLPHLATQTAYARLSPLTQTNRVTLLAQPLPGDQPLPFMDPAFAVAVCRYDLSTAPLKLTARISQPYMAVSFYDHGGRAFYAINDRAASSDTITLAVMTAAQRGRFGDVDAASSADRLLVQSPTAAGLIVLRALAPEPSLLPLARGILAAARCDPQP